MNAFIASNELFIRLGVFVFIFLLLSMWEIKYPRRQLTISKALRWCNNWAIVVFNALFLKITFPILGVAAAIYAQEKHLGLFNNIILPLWATVLLFVIIFDLVIYLMSQN